MSDGERLSGDTVGEFVSSLPVGETVEVEVNGQKWQARRLPDVAPAEPDAAPAEPDADGPWYLAVCRSCAIYTDALVMPFRDEAERDEWARAHAEANDHEVRKASHA